MASNSRLNHVSERSKIAAARKVLSMGGKSSNNALTINSLLTQQMFKENSKEIFNKNNMPIKPAGNRNAISAEKQIMRRDGRQHPKDVEVKCHHKLIIIIKQKKKIKTDNMFAPLSYETEKYDESDDDM